jgi:hypothetical protein
VIAQPTGARVVTGATSIEVGGLQNGVVYTFVVRALNAIGASEPSAPSPAVVPFGAPAVYGLTSSVSGQTITWTWQADGNGSPLAEFVLSVDGGPPRRLGPSTRQYTETFGPDERHVLSVRAVNAEGQQSPPVTRAATTQPVRIVTVGKGAPVNQPDCQVASCRFLVVTLQGFGPGEHEVRCVSAQHGSWYVYRTSAQTSSLCYFGFAGVPVWAEVDGVRSNTITW